MISNSSKLLPQSYQAVYSQSRLDQSTLKDIDQHQNLLKSLSLKLRKHKLEALQFQSQYQRRQEILKNQKMMLGQPYHQQQLSKIITNLRKQRYFKAQKIKVSNLLKIQTPEPQQLNRIFDWIKLVPFKIQEQLSFQRIKNQIHNRNDFKEILGDFTIYSQEDYKSTKNIRYYTVSQTAEYTQDIKILLEVAELANQQYQISKDNQQRLKNYKYRYITKKQKIWAYKKMMEDETSQYLKQYIESINRVVLSVDQIKGKIGDHKKSIQQFQNPMNAQSDYIDRLPQNSDHNSNIGDNKLNQIKRISIIREGDPKNQRTASSTNAIGDSRLRWCSNETCLMI